MTEDLERRTCIVVRHPDGTFEEIVTTREDRELWPRLTTEEYAFAYSKEAVWREK